MNPYEAWLGIRTAQQRPDYFALLGVTQEENDPAVIKAAAIRQLKKLQPHASGAHAEACQELQRRIKKAHQVLTTPELRARYLAQLQSASESSTTLSGDTDKAPQKKQSHSRPVTKPALSESVEEPQRRMPLAAIVGIVAAVALSACIAGGLLTYFFFTSRPTDETNFVTQIDPVTHHEPADSEPTDRSLAFEEPVPFEDPVAEPPTPHKADFEEAIPASIPPEVESFVEPEADAAVSLPTPPAPSPAAKPQEDPSEGMQETSSDPSAEALASVTPEPAEPVVATEELTQDAHGVLSTHCERCHGGGEASEGGFDFIADRDRLVSSGYVLPRNPRESPLLQRMLSEDAPMPPEGEEPRPSDEEIALVRDWIRSGAERIEEGDSRPFIGTQEQDRLAWSDLARLSRQDRPFQRYFSTTHLANAGFSDEELNTYRLALAKLINSISWNRQPVELESADDAPTLVRLDLRDLKWTSNQWEQVLATYPYSVSVDSTEAARLQQETGTSVPIIRGDWFVASASKPPLYHELLQLPKTDLELEDLLQVDVQQNIDERRVIRAAFARSGVSQHNRLIERHDSLFGPYWKSYDFAGSSGRKNLFEFPLGPGRGVDHFEHDGGEIIFTLPNGMLAFMLVDAFGRRIDVGPKDIVSDPRQPDRTVVNGVSCMSCHYGGFIPKRDEIRPQVVANQAAYPKAAEILQLYPGEDKFAAALLADTQKFLERLTSEEIGIKAPSRTSEPIHLVASRFENELDIVNAAAELGLKTEDLNEGLNQLGNDELDRQVGALKVPGGVIKRETFDSVFPELVSALEIGEGAVASVDTRRQPTHAPAGRMSQDRGLSGKRPGAAEAALSDGLQAIENRDWETALNRLQQAVRLADDDQTKLQAFEQLIPFYELQDSITNLIEAHQFILNFASGTTDIKTAHDNFFQSVAAFMDDHKATTPSWNRSRRHDSVNWGALEFPTSVANAIREAFQSTLDENPTHEPSLRVMYTYYHNVRDNVSQRKAILLALKKVLANRGEELDALMNLDLAKLHLSSGEPAEAAEIYQASNKRNRNSASAGFMLIQEAHAWIQAGENGHAKTALKSAQASYRPNDPSASSHLARIGDLYLQLNEPNSAAAAYRLAIKSEKHPSSIERMQEKLTTALEMNRGEGSHPGDSDGLMDPTRAFRKAAEDAERRGGTNPRSLFTSSMTAAENWLKANEQKNAERALRQADRAIRRLGTEARDSDHAGLASLFLQVEDHRQALDHFVNALNLATSESSIARFQNEVSALLDSHDDLQRTSEIDRMLEDGFALRSQARQKEAAALDTTAPSLQPRYLLDAAKLWAEAGEADEAIRVGKAAEASLKRLEQNATTASSTERFHVQLAEFYNQVGAHEPAIAQYVVAMNLAQYDRSAVDYHEKAKAISEHSGVPLPKLEKETAAKLDPLNQYRVEAAEHEERAEESPNSADSYYLRAAEAWLEAQENEKALAAAKKAEKALSAKQASRSRGFIDLAEVYEKLGENEEAIEAYQRALAVEKYDFRREEIQSTIDRLKASNES